MRPIMTLRTTRHTTGHTTHHTTDHATRHKATFATRRVKASLLRRNISIGKEIGPIGNYESGGRKWCFGVTRAHFRNSGVDSGLRGAEKFAQPNTAASLVMNAS